MVPSFRTWPSALGCRRERLESLVLFLLPGKLEQNIILNATNDVSAHGAKVTADS
jgi:hypothetical protein